MLCSLPLIPLARLEVKLKNQEASCVQKSDSEDIGQGREGQREVPVGKRRITSSEKMEDRIQEGKLSHQGQREWA